MLFDTKFIVYIVRSQHRARNGAIVLLCRSFVLIDATGNDEAKL
jgi:hypothetical protein